MGQLANAALLMTSPEFANWCAAAGAYQARLVILEPVGTADHVVRLKLANDVIRLPGVIAGLLVQIIATDPAVNILGGTAALVGEALVLSKTADVWTTLSKML